MMKSFSNEFFSAPATITALSMVLSVVGILVTVLLAELPSLRRSRHINIALMIRERSN
jgi:hypothetical protein